MSGKAIENDLRMCLYSGEFRSFLWQDAIDVLHTGWLKLEILLTDVFWQWHLSFLWCMLGRAWLTLAFDLQNCHGIIYSIIRGGKSLVKVVDCNKDKLYQGFCYLQDTFSSRSQGLVFEYCSGMAGCIHNAEPISTAPYDVNSVMQEAIIVTPCASDVVIKVFQRAPR